MSAKALVFLADGFEEVEAVSIIDVLRRGGVDVTVAGVGSGQRVFGAHAIGVAVDCEAEGVSAVDFDAVVLPGGMPGAENLAASGAVLSAVREINDAGGIVAAICAAPLVLATAGVVSGRRVTCYPGFEERVRGAECTGARVERDGNLVTGQGPGAALEFGLELLMALGEGGVANRLREGMLVR
jgi:4-methyl-5(b-hydroxyethyl)-thiazole monophosphate biosynthesis